MKTMVISQFKAKCIALLKEVASTREPLTVTLRGRPIATVQPLEECPPAKRLGALRGRMTLRRDLVRTSSSGDWEMLR